MGVETSYERGNPVIVSYERGTPVVVMRGVPEYVEISLPVA